MISQTLHVFLHRLTMDVRITVRSHVRSPGFALWCVLFLTLGVGVASAIASLAEATMLRPLPYPASEHLVVLEGGDDEHREAHGTPLSRLLEIEARVDEIEALGVVWVTEVNLMDSLGELTPMVAGQVAGQYLQLIGLEPQLGRLFSPEELEEHQPVAVLSDLVWRNRYSADPDIIGTHIALFGPDEALLIVGVGQRGHRDPRAVQVWATSPLPTVTSGPVDAPLDSLLERSPRPQGARRFWGLARRRGGSAIADIQLSVDRVMTSPPPPSPAVQAGFAVRVSDLRHGLVGTMRWPILRMLTAGMLILLVCAFRVANLFSTRTAGRSTEMELRRALGASDKSLVRLLAADVLAIGLAALPGAILVALLGVRLLASSGAVELPVFASPNDPVKTTLITIGIAFALGIGLTLTTAFRGVWASPGHPLRGVHASPLTGWTQDAFVSFQIAATAVLAISGAVLWDNAATIAAHQADLVAGDLSVARLTATVASIAAALAASMALSGMYSLLSFRVRTRTVELGIRLALGASKVRIAGAILRRIISGVGLLVCAASLPFARVLFHDLQVVGGTDAQIWLLGGTALAVISLTLLASVGPAVQATQVPPSDSFGGC